MSKITESARGELCAIRLPECCLFTPESTVWAHANGSAAGKGMWMKSHDLLGAYACQACHDVYDRRRPYKNLPRAEVELAFWEGHARSVLILIHKGLVGLQRGVMRVTA